ncbi:MAG: DUF2231 domain-containing protein [Bacteroidetes bacterium]|nr:DUF2231 domain-containing protein [Bacteroidota bacterium]
MDTTHLHPMLVHFPIALIIVGFLSEVCFWLYKKNMLFSMGSLYLLVLGTLGALAAVLSGLFLTAEMSGTAGQQKEIHELFGKITLGILILLSGFRLYLLWGKKEETGLRKVIPVVYAIVAGFVGYTGFLGGSLVYNFMIGV